MEQEKRQYVRREGLPSRKSNEAAYLRAYRKARPTYALENQLSNNARAVAALKVAKNHPREFQSVLEEERRKRYLPT